MLGLTFFVFLAVAATLLLLGCAACGVWEFATGRATVIEIPRGTVARLAGATKLVTAIALAGAPFVAAPLAERRVGWSDPDGDGMYSSLVNGRYDWLDIVGGTFELFWLLSSVFIVVMFAVVTWLLAARSPVGEALHVAAATVGPTPQMGANDGN